MTPKHILVCKPHNALAARCTEAFLADLVKASAERARAAGDRESERKRRKGPPSALLRQVLPEDV